MGKFDKYKGKKKDKPPGIAEKVIHLLDILNKIDRNEHPSAASLAKEFGLTRRTIHRYLEIINFIVPIEYSKEKKGYIFVSNRSLKKLDLDDNEMALMVLLGDAISHMGSPIKTTYQSIIEKLESSMSGHFPEDLPIAFNMPEAVDSETLKNNFPIVLSACLNKNSLNIKYHSIHTDETSERTIDPYALIYSEGRWLVVAHCQKVDELRKFDVACMLEVEKTWMKFDDKGFNLKQYMDERWGLYDGDPTTVKVRFDKEVAPLITNKEKWHPSEKRKILKNGDVELTFKVGGTEKLKRWIYSWIPYAKVISPQSFVKEINDDIKQYLS